MNRAKRAGVFKTGDLTPEEVLLFMEATESGSEYDDDDDLIFSDAENDADYDPHVDEISPEDDIAIDLHLQAAGNDTRMLADAINMSLNLSLDDTPSASSTMHPILSLSHEEEVETTEPQPSTSVAVDVRPANVATATGRPAKRLRSPLPSMEAIGPTILPTAGGFNGQSKCFLCESKCSICIFHFLILFLFSGLASIKIKAKEFSKILYKNCTSMK